ncbi:MAG: hypothetical protein M4579_001082 [Chaenotheca gracillima]|nr:MAG: hypothetical protein M4579_001082 [Chaenotheca gracillima]
MSTAGAVGPAAVHLKIRTAPRSLHTTRQILRVLQEHGEVLAFRTLRNEFPTPKPRHAIAVFAHPASAISFVKKSPLQLRLLREPEPSADARRAGVAPAPATTSSRHEGLHVTKSEEDSLLETEILAQHSDFHYQSLISNGPYYGPFTPDLRSLEAADLKNSGVPYSGLQDWIGAVGREKRAGSMQGMRLLRKKRDTLRAGRLNLRELWEKAIHDKPRSID